jgi:3-hydroxybutyryl-CoA dehydrogenase
MAISNLAILAEFDWAEDCFRQCGKGTVRIVIVGDAPFLPEAHEVCVSAGHMTGAIVAGELSRGNVSDSILDQVADAELVIEMHNESAQAKRSLVCRLDDMWSQEALVLSMAMATSATQAAAWVDRPERVVGFGLISPIGERPMVELAPALQTAEAYLEAADAFWQGLGFETVLVSDGPGLVRARVLCCLINEAASALMEGVATAEDIDLAMKLGTNYPYGPLEWADHLGLDCVLGVMIGLFDEWGDDRYRPTPLLRRMVLAGQLGKKTKKGFFDYS